MKYPDLIKRAFQLFSKLNFIRITDFSNSLAANEMNIFLIRKKSNGYHFPKEMGGKKIETLFQNFSSDQVKRELSTNRRKIESISLS